MVAWLTQAKINIWNWALKAMFYFIKSFLTRNIVSYPRQIFVAGALLRTPSPRHSVIFFLILPFQNLELKICSPSSERRTDTLKLLFKKASNKKIQGETPVAKSVGLQTSLKKILAQIFACWFYETFQKIFFLKTPQNSYFWIHFIFFRIITRKWRNQKITHPITKVSSIKDFLA